MDDKSFNIRVPKKWARYTMVAVVTALIVAPLTAIASHSFTDVPDTHTFHSDIEWLKDAGVTAGCNPPQNTEFCPGDDVTRGQMSAFMRRFAKFIGAEDGTPAQADNAATADKATSADNATTADNATKLAGSTPGAVTGPLFWSTTATTVETLDTISIDVPAAGTVIVQVTGTVWMNHDSADANADTVFSFIGLCDSAASSSDCAGTYQDVWYQDPDATDNFNATPAIGLLRVYNVSSAGTLTVHVNGEAGTSDSFSNYNTDAVVTYLPGANSLEGLTITTNDGPGPSQTE